MNTDVEDLLREGMERFTAELRAPAGIVCRAAQRRRRRLVLRSAAGAAALTAGVAVLAVVTLPGAVRSAASGPAVDTAYVVQQVGSALNAAEPADIAQMTITTAGAPLRADENMTTTAAREWSYGDQWRAVTYSSPGHPAYDEGTSSAGVYTLASYLTKTWARQSGLGRPAKLPSPPASGKHGCAPAFAGFPVLFRFGLPALGPYASATPATAATALRTAVSCGTLDVAGHQQVNGIDAIKLTSRPDSLISETIWVSPGTYLPVRVVVHPAAGGPGLEQTVNIAWLPPTAQNLAKLTVPVPAGFRKVSFAQAGLPILRLVPAGLLPRPAALCPPPSSAGPACTLRVLPGPPGPFKRPAARVLAGPRLNMGMEAPGRTAVRGPGPCRKAGMADSPAHQVRRTVRHLPVRARGRAGARPRGRNALFAGRARERTRPGPGTLNV